REIDELSIVIEDNSGDALNIPEQLVDIVMSDDVLMVLLSGHELPINDFIALVTNELAERLRHSLQIEAFRYGLDAILTLG
ncbi:hypothetical protein BDN70DRAFT_817746, partial [Pholiota conissans]